MLTRVPGIGNKTAERMIIDMRDRLEEFSVFARGITSPVVQEIQENSVQDAVGALIALGYKSVDANTAVCAVESDSHQRDDLIRNALQYLTKR